MNSNNIFIDTNVLIGAYLRLQKDEKAWRYLCSLKGKRLFTSALSIAQLASVFQKRKKNSEIRQIIADIMHKTTVLACNDSDIKEALTFEQADIEDNIQYAISSKMKCYYFITNNIKDYTQFTNIHPLSPSDARTIPR